MRRIGSHNENPKAAKMEQLREDGINAIGLGPQGLRGKNSVLGVNIENSARHPSVIGVAVNVAAGRIAVVTSFSTRISITRLIRIRRWISDG